MASVNQSRFRVIGVWRNGGIVHRENIKLMAGGESDSSSFSGEIA
jgi:hypothetical protein